MVVAVAEKSMPFPTVPMTRLPSLIVWFPDRTGEFTMVFSTTASNKRAIQMPDVLLACVTPATKLYKDVVLYMFD